MLSWPVEQPRLVGADVTLRGWQPSDAPGVFKACQDSTIQRWTTVPTPYLMEHAVDFVSTWAAQVWLRRQGAGFAVCRPGSGELLGACGLIGIEADQLITGAGYWVAPWARGRHVAQHALALITEWALSAGGLKRVELQIEPGNVASQRAALGAGYEPTNEPPIRTELKGVSREFHIYARTT